MSNPSLAVPRRSFAAVCAAGLIALASAMGIGRFAFTPMLPLMIGAGTADVVAGGWLGAANYAGYLLGALTTARLPLTPQRAGLSALTVIAASTAAMGWTGSFAVWMALRFFAGVASAWALVSTSVWCLEWLTHFGRPAGAGALYAGVGVGIALAGLYCWHGAVTGLSPDALWLQMGAIALAAVAIVWAVMPRGLPAGAVLSREPVKRPTSVARGLVVCYGALGFGYILPATFLPVLARTVVNNPAVFGAAWPVFGVVAALSTLCAGAVFAKVPRRRVLASSYVLIALGCVLPVLYLSVTTVFTAAMLVGGTFMVATMAGMQEAKATASGDPTRALSRMTAAFATGQMAGPLLSSALSASSNGFQGLFAALAVGAAALLASAAWLARIPRILPDKR